VAHSWGVLVALAHAVDHRADTGALLLLSGYYFPTRRLDVVIASLPAIPVIGDLLRYTILIYPCLDHWPNRLEEVV
jgi:pimeloyl-ACP methyl ester carboxylesterase